MSCGCAQQTSFPALGNLRLGQATAPVSPPVQPNLSSDIKTGVGPDLAAGAIGFVLPLAYDGLAPKTWPQLKLWSRIGLVLVGYLGSAWAIKKLTA